MGQKPRLLQIGGLGPGMAERLRETFDVTVLDDQPDRAAFLSEHGTAFTMACTDGHEGVRADVAENCTGLKLVASYGVGYDQIDGNDMARRGIIVTHTPTVLDEEVADTALMLWLAAAKELVAAHDWAESGKWETDGNYPLTRGIRNRTVGILGLGRIGSEIARLAEVFGARVLYSARSRKDVNYGYFADPVEMAREAEVLFVITPLTDATHHLVGKEMMDALGPEGILINIARGPVVNEAALCAAIEEGRLGAAALDVFEDEPRIPNALKGRRNVVLAPHIGSATVETRDAMGALVCRNLESFARDGTVLTPIPETAHLATRSDEAV